MAFRNKEAGGCRAVAAKRNGLREAAMYFRKVIVTFALIVAALAAIRPVARAQAPAETNDPVARAMKRIETAIEGRAFDTDRIIAASMLLKESAAARKQGGRERAEALIRQAETITAEVTPSLQSHLLDELARSIAAERAALNPAPPEKAQTHFEDALPAQRPTRNVTARYGNYQRALARILIEEQVPIELLAVALVESGFNPQAL